MDKIKKHKYQRDFTIVNNEFLKDKLLSWKAKGIISYTTMLPDDWELNMNDLKNRAKDGRDSLMSGVNELIKAGYCRRIRTRDEGGQISGVSYEIADFKAFKPQTENPVTVSPQTGFPDTVKPDTGFPDTENPQLLSTKEKQSTKGTKNEKPKNGVLFPEQNPNKKTLFRNCVFNDYELFEKQFKQPEFANVDLSYYFNSVADWSDSSNTKRTAKGWIATARNFMRGDIDKKRLKMKITGQTAKQTSDTLDYLKGNFE